MPGSFGGFGSEVELKWENDDPAQNMRHTPIGPSEPD